MMRFYLERLDMHSDQKERKGAWITLPMDQDELDDILEELGIVAEKNNFIINNFEDEYIENLQHKLFVEDFAEMNELARDIEIIYDGVADKINKILKDYGEISIPEFYEIAELIDDFVEDVEEEDED